MKIRMKKSVFMALALILMVVLMGILAVRAAAATTLPANVKRQAVACMNREKMNEVVVIQTTKNRDGSRTGTIYLIYRNSRNGSPKVDISSKVIIGKNEHLLPSGHYRFYRNRDAEKRLMTWTENGTKYRQRYTSFIDCDEGAAFNLMVHSFVEYRKGSTWNTCKGTSLNDDGVAVCKTTAQEIWSCCDDSCPVVFMN